MARERVVRVWRGRYSPPVDWIGSWGAVVVFAVLLALFVALGDWVGILAAVVGLAVNVVAVVTRRRQP
jgi:hypothetical protein